ncbi:substrate-binding periplasmic protein [Thalassolituus sp. LLYu03]|uniref:substrate-binding periplasmic protein n=1 Tax=Thalassolituus sp. LLYu03 TaxID=3421656 RepID=UPI003D2BA3F4
MTLRIRLLLLLTGLLALPVQADICPAGGVKVGWEPWEPYAFEKSGAFTGLDLDMATAVLQKMGCPYTYVNRPWKRLLTEIESGALTMTGGASRTAEREVYGHFSDPYRTESAVLFVRKTDAAGLASVKTLRDLIGRNFKLGFTRGYYYGENYAALENDPGFKALLVEAGDDVTNYKKVAARRLDGFLADPFSAAAGFKTENMTNQFAPLMTVYSDDIYFLISKKAVSAEFMAAFNKGLADLKASGEYRALLDKYLQ